MKSVKLFALLTVSPFVTPLFQLPPPPLHQMPCLELRVQQGQPRQCSQQVNVLKEMRSVLLGV